MNIKVAELLCWIAWKQPRYYLSPLAKSIEREYIVPCERRTRSIGRIGRTLQDHDKGSNLNVEHHG